MSDQPYDCADGQGSGAVVLIPAGKILIGPFVKRGIRVERRQAVPDSFVAWISERSRFTPCSLV